MGLFESKNRAAEPDVVDPSIEKAYADVTLDCKTVFYVSLNILKDQLAKKLLPGEEVLFMDGAKGGAIAITNRRVVWQSTMGMKSSALPMSDTLQVAFNHKLTSGLHVRFTADGGRELNVKGMVLSPQRVNAMKAALPVGTTF